MEEAHKIETKQQPQSPHRAMRTMTWNIRQGTKERIPLDNLHAHEIDVAFLTETGEGADFSRDLASQGEDGYAADQPTLTCRSDGPTQNKVGTTRYPRKE
jgi:hypothetical protein